MRQMRKFKNVEEQHLYVLTKYKYNNFYYSGISESEIHIHKTHNGAKKKAKFLGLKMMLSCEDPNTHASIEEVIPKEINSLSERDLSARIFIKALLVNDLCNIFVSYDNHINDKFTRSRIVSDILHLKGVIDVKDISSLREIERGEIKFLLNFLGEELKVCYGG